MKKQRDIKYKYRSRVFPKNVYKQISHCFHQTANTVLTVPLSPTRKGQGTEGSILPTFPSRIRQPTMKEVDCKFESRSKPDLKYGPINDKLSDSEVIQPLSVSVSSNTSFLLHY